MRVIARLDIKNNFVIKGIHLEGLRKVGDPIQMAKAYYACGIDEIMFIDAVASLYNRNNLFSVIKKASEDVFVPITIGGGIRSLNDIEQALDAGADKVALNTAAIRTPELIEDAAKRYGSQCIVASVQAKRISNSWEAYIEGGREKTGIRVLDWVRKLQELGAGELLLTSIDQEGTKHGFDNELIQAVNSAISIPLVVSGGYGRKEHIDELYKSAEPSGICFASALHYKISTIDEIRNYINSAKVNTS